MRKIFLTTILIALAVTLFGQEKILYGKEASAFFDNAEMVRIADKASVPSYIKFQSGSEMDEAAFLAVMKKNISKAEKSDFKIVKTESDKLSRTHKKYQQCINQIPVEYAFYKAHIIENKVQSCSGVLYNKSPDTNSPVLTEQEGLSKALTYYPASVYMWQVAGADAWLKEFTGNPDASYFPKGELVYFPQKNEKLILAYKFNIYAQYPLKRAMIYIDATNGELLFQNILLHATDVQGTAVTKYSGTQTITSDSYNGSFRLRETGRGNGIQTFDMNMGDSYQNATDFTDDDNYWNNVNTELDEVATDAHWATEKTYDYYYLLHGRNSIDGNGFALRSYIHADLVAFGLPNNANAFWNGECMTYGDGNSNISPLTTVDICGHEITHGLTSYTAELVYAEESGAMNEGFSDIFGTAIEFYAKPSMANWTMGEDIGSWFRSMEDPSSNGYPDTYQGANWDFDQEVHHNSTVMSHWFYILSEGASGTNDIGNTFNVTGQSISVAEQIAFRTLVTYLPPSSTFADARFYSIIAATDLYGACSNEVEAVTNAWYAVGVGNAYVPYVVSSFSSDFTAFCDAPATVNFINESANGQSFLWNFGDGTTSTDINPSHTYSSQGTFTVTLNVDGGSCGTDSHVENQYISISPANPCIVIIPQIGSTTITQCSGTLYDSGGLSAYQNSTDVTVTITPQGAASVTLTFSSFDFESGYDYLYIYDGPNTSSPLIGQYDGTSLPNGGVITSSGGSITLRQYSDEGVIGQGFELDWLCSVPYAPPVANFSSSVISSCMGLVSFTDVSSNAPDSWHWDFGDGTTSTQNNPQHIYSNDGVYTVTLISANSYGSDTIIKNNNVAIDLADAPFVTNDTICTDETALLTALGNGIVSWYENQSGGVPFFIGSSFTTSTLSNNVTYFVRDSVDSPLSYTGATDKTATGNYWENDVNRTLIFDVLSSVNLKSVKIYSNTARTLTFQVVDNTLAVVTGTTVIVPQGESRVTLNFSLTPGNAYQLRTLENINNLWRDGSTNGPILPYPYTIENVIRITGNNANNTRYYYFFYDWEVQEPVCVSPRVPVSAIVETCSGISSASDSDEIELYPNPAKNKLFISNLKSAGIIISDINGKEILNLHNFDNSYIDISELNEGFYFCKIIYGNTITIKKFVITK
ncbi:MAG: hypothetical protein A2275_09130 [Bacteroidetes bacterium RIFOXYA12_FULL_35_11]|nr:MAG: hypothetical protein A2X01_01175 [Bacteroidetes bacterium GWF2_35_48]OFY73660.1 MAG: hypothetical protein A2275_09130 [Bacteroidetes bacterium RIFOXYA12_FULL_35_11]OFY96627.1 MAG: hypothetical protein A2309_05755 [Bacteroidetes bacterium RIFOXYB2_FULL_35_7]HBX51189.1 hypothetical protein [Bacteroidales bacterium]